MTLPLAPAAITLLVVQVIVWAEAPQLQPVPPDPEDTYVNPGGKVSVTVIAPDVGAFPLLLGVIVKLAAVPTPNELALAVFVNCKSGDCTTVTTAADVLLPAPVRPVSSGSVIPMGTIAVAVFDKVPDCGAVP
jgi:hypothetical protein